MAARITRRQARQKMIDVFTASLDKIIPPDEAVPLRGRTFLDWEKQAEQLRRARREKVTEGKGDSLEWHFLRREKGREKVTASNGTS